MRKASEVGLWVVILGACFIMTGCATGKVKFGDTVSQASLDKYKTVAIQVVNDAGPKCPAEVPGNLQAAAIKQLQAKYPDAFQSGRPSPKGTEDELLVEVHIVKYKKGSRFARAMLIGLGASSISTNVNFLDSPTKKLLTSGKLELTWALGGIAGASRGIEDLVNDSGAKVATAIVEQKQGKAAKQSKPQKGA